MTYEEKYKQALKVAKKELQACGDLDCDAARQIFRLFPELKEAEDERIRKVLIEHFEGSHSSMFPYKGFTKEQIIAWLEKQGEQKPVEEITSNPDYVSPKDKALFKIATVLSKNEDKEGSPLEEIRSILVDYGINNLDSQEKKPVEWSDEDKIKINAIIEAIDNYWSDDTQAMCELKDWLKSLKDR